MPLINALLFLVLAGTGLTGYGLMRHFEKLEMKRYVEWQINRSRPVWHTEPETQRTRYKKAG